MNHLLFRVAEVEESLQRMSQSSHEAEQLEARRQLGVLDSFKYRPIRSYDESQHLLWEFNNAFPF